MRIICVLLITIVLGCTPENIYKKNYYKYPNANTMSVITGGSTYEGSCEHKKYGLSSIDGFDIPEEKYLDDTTILPGYHVLNVSCKAMSVDSNLGCSSVEAGERIEINIEENQEYQVNCIVDGWSIEVTLEKNQ